MNLPLKLKEREKKFLVFGAVAAALIIIYHIYGIYSEFSSKADVYIDSQMLLLEKQMRQLASADELKKKEELIRQDISRYKSLFLQGSKPPVAAAELQKTLKEMSSSLNIEIRVERALNPVESEFYTRIPVEIGFVTSTDSLRALLEKIRQTPFLITVSEMKVRVSNLNKPESINVTLVVTGFIQKGDQSTSDSEEGANVA